MIFLIYSGNPYFVDQVYKGADYSKDDNDAWSVEAEANVESLTGL